jgi:hypothetical protein
MVLASADSEGRAPDRFSPADAGRTARFFAALGRFVVRFRWVVVAAWIVGTILIVHALPTLGSQIDNNNSAFLPFDSPSNVAARLAQPLAGSVSKSRSVGDHARPGFVVRGLDRPTGELRRPIG